MEDLIGVCVPDSAEQPRVRERTLQRVIFASELTRKSRFVNLERLKSAAVEFGQRLLASNEGYRCPALRSCFGENQRTVLEIECCQPQPARNLRSRIEPTESSGDHQMNDDPHITIQTDANPFSDPPYVANAPTLSVTGKRIDRAYHERARDPNPFQYLPGNTCRDCFDINSYVRELWHLTVGPLLKDARSSCQGIGYVQRLPQRGDLPRTTRSSREYLHCRTRRGRTTMGRGHRERGVRHTRATLKQTLFAMLGAWWLAACASAGVGSRERSLRVMSYNIQYGHEGLDSVIAVINAERPDIVGLQEVDVHWGARSGFRNQAELIARATGMEFRFAPIYTLPSATPGGSLREFGVGLLSRHRIVSFTNHAITRLSTQEASPEPSRMPGFLDAIVLVRGQRVRVYNVHLDFRRDPGVRAMQVADMLAVIGPSDMPELMFGDLNAGPGAPEIEPLFRRFRDSWPYEQGPGLTGPARNPAGKIDYVLTSHSFKVRQARVPRVFASDHFPVVVDLVLERR